MTGLIALDALPKKCKANWDIEAFPTIQKVRRLRLEDGCHSLIYQFHPPAASLRIAGLWHNLYLAATVVRGLPNLTYLRDTKDKFMVRGPLVQAISGNFIIDRPTKQRISVARPHTISMIVQAAQERTMHEV